MEDEDWRGLVGVGALVITAAEAALGDRASGDLTVLLTDDESVRKLNSRFRSKDVPTNVLSFPAPGTARPHLGDIALGHGVCAAEAAAQGKRLADHLSHLVVHGVLHLLGYDHQADAPAEAMEAMERHILADLGVADPYRPDPVHAGP